MKKILILLLTVGLFVSCSEESLDPLPIKNPGAYVLLEVERPVIDVTAIQTSSFGGTLRTPGATVVSYELFVRRFSNGIYTEFVPLTTVTTFPSELAISAPDIAAALGIDVNDILAGDRFDFRAESTDVDGNVTTYVDLSPDTQGEVGQQQAYQFLTYVSCPFDAAASAGTYEILESVFSDVPLGPTFEVEVGAAAGQLILVDIYSHKSIGGFSAPNDFEVVANVNPFGILSIPETINGARQFLWHAGLYNPDYNQVWPRNAAGFMFTCTGSLSFTYNQMLTLTSQGAAVFGFNAIGVLKAQKI